MVAKIISALGDKVLGGVPQTMGVFYTRMRQQSNGIELQQNVSYLSHNYISWNNTEDTAGVYTHDEAVVSLPSN